MSIVTRLGNSFSHLFLLVIRLYWGCLFTSIGWNKWMTLSQTADFFASLGIPYSTITATIVAGIECIGGICLVLGLWSRFMALLLAIVCIGAYSTAHATALSHLFTNPQIVFFESPFLYLYASLVVFSFGPGLFSIDACVGKK